MIETLITSSVLIMIIIFLRTVFKGRIKSTLRYALWLIAAVRLVLPFSLIESSVSVMNLLDGLSVPPAAEIQQEDNTYFYDTPSGNFSGQSGQPKQSGRSEPSGVSQQPEQVYSPYEPASGNYDNETSYTEHPYTEYYSTMYYQKAQPVSGNASPEKKPVSPKTILTIVWISGASVMLIWFGAVNCIFYFGLRRTRKIFDYDAPLKIYSTEGIISPCIFGSFKPAIYLPEKAACENDAIRFVVTHELCHYYHGDMIWVTLRYLLLALYWFDPFVWAAAILSKRDCECACDEAAIRRVGEDSRFEYGKAVIDLIPRKHGDMFGIVSTSMASSKNVLKERMTMIAAKPKNRRFALAVSVMAVVFAACGTFTSAVSNADIYADMDTSTEQGDTVSENEPLSVEQLSAESKSVISVNVTDYTGADRTLYYVVPPDSSYEAYVYMDDISGDNSITPARYNDFYSVSGMRDYMTSSRFSKAEITMKGETKTLTRSANPADFEDLFEAQATLVPYICPEEVSGEPFAEINFSRENGGFSSTLTIRLFHLNDRVAGYVITDDHYGLFDLVTSDKQPPDPEMLENVYYESVHTFSGFFYAEYTDLYEFLVDLFKGDTSSTTENIKYAEFGTDWFSAELGEHLGATGEVPHGYVMTRVKNVMLAVPYDGNKSGLDDLLLWQMRDMELRITKDGTKTLPEGTYYKKGKFGGRDCIYCEDSVKKEISLVFSDYNENTYTAVFEYNSEDDINIGRKIFGTIHLDERSVPVYLPTAPVSSEPSIYGDENHEIVSDIFSYPPSYRPDSPVMLMTGFQVINGVTDYEIGYDCYIESKVLSDGEWHKVIPLADIVQENNSYRHFYTEEEGGYITCCLDLSCYPLLPVGYYRLVMPFRLKGSDKDEFAALSEFYISEIILPEDDLLCTARCINREISPDTKSITYEIKANKTEFALSEIADIERETPDGWESVRTGAIKTNSLHASFPLAFPGTYELDTSDFDISVPGNYRIRLSYGNGGPELKVPRNAYETAYAYFEVK